MAMIVMRHLFTVLMAGWILLPGEALALPEKTVVIRVVGTDQTWGQEPKPGWPNASPVKEAPGYRLYDLEIGRVPGPNAGDSTVPGYLALYLFKGYSDRAGLPKAFAGYGATGQALEGDVFTRYKNQSLIKKISLSPLAESIDWQRNSRDVLAALKTLTDQIIRREKNVSRWILSYSGHGAPWVFFEGMMSNPDSQVFMKYLRQKTAKKTLIMDFSTNCDVGFFDFVLRYHQYADYLIASDKQVGGYAIGQEVFNEWLRYDSDTIYDKTWRSAHTLNQAFDKTLSNLETVWSMARDSLRQGRVEQSLSMYKLADFPSFMQTLKAHGFNTADLPLHSSDLATYAYDSGDPALIEALEQFRSRYISNRAYAEWTDDSRGFSVDDPGLLEDYLDTLD